jgi:hypothetical protein
MCGHAPLLLQAVVSMMFIIALTATLLAFFQNSVMFRLGMKEQAIFSFPLSFVGVFLAEFVLIWTGYFCIRRFLRHRRELLLAGWTMVVLGAAEPMLPASYFTTLVQHAKRKHVLERIEQADSSIEALASDQGGTRFALTYSLRFPKTARYLTFPAYLGPEGNRVFGNYFTKLHPEYYDENYVFDAGKLYSFTVVFETEGKQFDFSKEKANIDICDGKTISWPAELLASDLRACPRRLLPIFRQAGLSRRFRWIMSAILPRKVFGWKD